MKKTILALAAGILLTILILSFRPIFLSGENSKMLSGVIDSIYIDGHDLFFTISGDNRSFYINRADDKNLDIQHLIKELPGKTVDLCYADQWTPLDPFSSQRHVTQLTVGHDLLFTEL